MSIQLITPRCSAFIRPTWFPLFHLRYNDSLLWDGTGTELDWTQPSHTLFFDLDPRQAEGRAFWVYNNTDLFFSLSWCIYTGARPPRSWANGIAGNGYRNGERDTGNGKSGFDDVNDWKSDGVSGDGLGSGLVRFLPSGRRTGRALAFSHLGARRWMGSRSGAKCIGHGVGW